MEQQLNNQCHFPDVFWYQDAELPEPVANLVRAHVSECEVCHLQANGELVVQRLLRRVEFEPAPAGLQMRIHTKITTLRIES